MSEGFRKNSGILVGVYPTKYCGVDKFKVKITSSGGRFEFSIKSLKRAMQGKMGDRGYLFIEDNEILFSNSFFTDSDANMFAEVVRQAIEKAIEDTKMIANMRLVREGLHKCKSAVIIAQIADLLGVELKHRTTLQTKKDRNIINSYSVINGVFFVRQNHLRSIAFEDIRVGDVIKVTIPEESYWNYRVISSVDSNCVSGVWYLLRDGDRGGTAIEKSNKERDWILERVDADIAPILIAFYGCID